MGTVNLLEAVRRHPSARSVLVVTSDKCYENREWPWGYRENEAMGGHDPYSSSKGCTELVTASYRNSFFPPGDHARHGVAVASARAGNVVGGGDWSEDRLVPDILDAHANGRELIIRSPAAVRPWQFVLEPLRGYMTLAERLHDDGRDFAGAWNFGPRDEDVLTVEDLISRLSSHLDGGISYRVTPDETPHEATTLKLDCSKAAARLGWRPRTTIDAALRWIADWQNAFLAGQDMREVSIQQIESFQRIAQGCR
jgi:CDP-glucose 4,6-dehydratase